MSHYDSDTIEEVAVSEVKRLIRRAGNGKLSSNIAQNDKEPSWDGNIKLYKEANSKSKDNIDGLISIQVKGKEIKSFDNKFISYPIEISDLENYLAEGVIYFVVEILPPNEECKVFYKVMNSMNIKLILDEVYNFKSSNKKQKTKNIKIDSILNEKVDFYKECSNFKQHKDHQSLYLVNNAIDFKKIKNHNKLEFLTLPNPHDAINKIIHPYVKDEYGVLVPVKGELKITAIKGKLSITEKDELKKYFDEINFIKNETEEYIECGDIIRYYPQDEEIKLLTSKGTIIQRIRTLEFFIDNISKDISTLNKDDLNKVECCKKELKDLKEIEELCKKLSIDTLKTFTTDITNSDMNKLKLNNLIYSIPEYTKLPKLMYKECKLTLLEFLKKRILLFKGIRGDLCECIDFYDKEFNLELTVEGDNTFISRFALLSKDAILCDNFDENIILDSITSYTKKDNGKYADFYLGIVLELIKAWDEVNNDKYLSTAKKILELLSTFLENEIVVINSAQIEFRLYNKFSDKTLGELYKIRYKCKNDLFVAGTLILLKEYNDFQKVFNTFDSEKKELFIRYPIYNLLKNNLELKQKCIKASSEK